MKDKEDVSFYVVTLNQLTVELNQITRDMFNADVEDINRVCRAIITNAQILSEKVKP